MISTYVTSSRNIAQADGAGIGVIQVLTSSVNLPSIIFRNEFLFIQMYWNIITNGTNNGADENYVFGPTASLIRPTPFVADNPRFFKWVGSENY